MPVKNTRGTKITLRINAPIDAPTVKAESVKKATLEFAAMPTDVSLNRPRKRPSREGTIIRMATWSQTASQRAYSASRANVRGDGVNMDLRYRTGKRDRVSPMVWR